MTRAPGLLGFTLPLLMNFACDKSGADTRTTSEPTLSPQPVETKSAAPPPVATVPIRGERCAAVASDLPDKILVESQLDGYRVLLPRTDDATVSCERAGKLAFEAPSAGVMFTINAYQPEGPVGDLAAYLEKIASNIQFGFANRGVAIFPRVEKETGPGGPYLIYVVDVPGFSQIDTWRALARPDGSILDLHLSERVPDGTDFETAAPRFETHMALLADAVVFPDP